MSERRCVAVDLGAESGRIVVGTFDGHRLGTEIVHRFPNRPRMVDGHLRWDVAALWSEIVEGLSRAGAAEPVDSVGVDSWGIDFGYLDERGDLVADPVSHRDARTDGTLNAAAQMVGRERLYRDTGIQLMQINAVFQLLAESRAGGPPPAARRLLMIPDLFHHLLSGSSVAEFTAVSTTGAYDVAGRAWATKLLDDLGIRTDLLPEVVDAGTDLGAVVPALATLPGLASTRVITPGSHDTASAVAAVPFADPYAGYISSGTWSLVGVELVHPVVNESSRKANLTNEGGVAGTVRLLRNVMGLWVLQECRRQWAREGRDIEYPALVALAAEASAMGSIVDVDHPSFVHPGDMPARVRDYCRSTGQPVPSTVGEVARSVLEGLALRYRAAFDSIAEVTGRPTTLVHIVGGGSRNDLLNQLTADVTGLAVHAGPVEATAMGNLLVQLVALGELGGLDDVREVVRRSDCGRLVEPRDPSVWGEHYTRFRDLVASATPVQDLVN
ncbi:rhamnulokinase [Micromonospora globispora]|uniref:Rhamnulokinase n=1 Tax=Micromonospora globispora TaxID=1450148 RepID=A0A317K954_9ACTN|nr:rhamnulokinase family protein [Micromonospora globispora]PWU47693.1 rhamnulokinase [Micromonospora globispora]RQW82841.1 rhamnulokinase [Micromonospora globispora]